MKKVKRLCLFAGYDSKGVILKYVIHYVKAMSELANVYYMADCEMAEEELDKLAPYTKERYAYRHKKYDFGSWQELINKIGWDKVAEYDELILCNDSCFGPLNNSLPYIFEKASNDNECDFWGASSPLDNQHLQSYFLVFKRNVFTNDIFKKFIESISMQNDKKDICIIYEIGLFNILQDKGFIPKQIIDLLGDLCLNWDILIKNNFPFLKTSVLYSITLYNNSYILENNSKKQDSNYNKRIASVKNIDNIIKKYTKYDLNLIEEYLNHVGLNIKMYHNTTFKYDLIKFKRNLKFLRRNIFWRVNSHDRKLLRIFGKNILNKSFINPLLQYDELKQVR